MTLISRLKSLLGLDGDRREPRGTTVAVEREPAAEPEPATGSERAVKEPVPSTSAPSGSTGTAATGATEPEPSVDDVVEEAEPDVDEWAEPDDAEAPAAGGNDEPVQSLSGIGPAYADRLGEAGVETVGDLASADASALAEATGLGESRVAGWIDQAKDA